MAERSCGDERLSLDRRCAARDAQDRTWPEGARVEACAVQESLEHLGGGTEIGDDPVTQRVHDLHPFRLPPGEPIGGEADAHDLAGRLVERDGRRLVYDQAVAEQVHEGVDGPEVDGNS